MSITSKEVIGIMECAGRLDGNAIDSLVPFIRRLADFVLIHEARGWQS